MTPYERDARLAEIKTEGVALDREIAESESNRDAYQHRLDAALARSRELVREVFALTGISTL